MLILPDNKPLFGTPLAGNQYSGGLVGFWPFRQAGNLVDYSHFGNHGELKGDTSWGGQSLIFGGTNGYVEIQNSPSITLTDSFTLIGKFKPIVVQQSGIYQSGTNANYWAMLHRSDETFSIFERGLSEVVFNTDAVFGEWYTFAVVKSGDVGTNIFLYHDGVPDGSGSAGPVATPTGVASIGRLQDLADFLGGEVEYMSLYNRALSASEVRALFINPWLPIQQDRFIFSPAVAVGAVRLINGGLINTGLVGGRLIA